MPRFLMIFILSFIMFTFSANVVVAEGPGFFYCPGQNCPCGNDGLPASGCKNSTGIGAVLVAKNSASISRDDLSFGSLWLPPHSIAYFAMGHGDVAKPFGGGLICLGAEVYRLKKPLVVNEAGSVGISHAISAFATYSGVSINPGDFWCFQMVYRDPYQSCGARPMNRMNATGAYCIQFVP